MTAQTHSNDHELARVRTMRAIAIAVAVIAFLVLVVGFGLTWKAYYQVAAGLVAYIAIEWQRRCSRRLKELSGGTAA